ncbi:hypothetical protein IQ235_15865 [Oscillatoriales cyanobacterium LEGE 11467]|uniref:SMI1/KNR4 family protein n=1 Tax=Zarconia navalis LEGE 11467 TaxID=1828826 RepID=A0A928W2Z6_9CYAN|nr:hypothetical protein [Zarconia navalis LEGE 11467]
MKHHQPDSYAALEPGLSRSELDYFLEPFPFLLPAECYELYQWHDGMTPLDMGSDIYNGSPYQLFPGYTFNPIQEAIDLRSNIFESVENLLLYKMRHEEGIWIEHSGLLNCYFLPIFTLDLKEHICLLGTKETVERSYLFKFFSEGEIYFLYDSISSMMQTIAACYKVGAYYNFKYPDGDKEIRCDKNLAEEIRIQYNPNAALYS